MTADKYQFGRDQMTKPKEVIAQIVEEILFCGFVLNDTAKKIGTKSWSDFEKNYGFCCSSIAENYSWERSSK